MVEIDTAKLLAHCSRQDPASLGRRTHAMHITPAAVMAFGLMLLLIGLMVEGRRPTWIYIGLIVLALVILWPIFIMLYRGI
jgi:hypothetical protein